MGGRRGLIGSSDTCSTLCQISVTFPATHNQILPFWCCFLSGWVCIHSGTLWVSPTTSLMRLGVPPSAALTPKGVFSQWFEALFPAGTQGCAVSHPVHQLLPRWPAAALPSLLHSPPPCCKFSALAARLSAPPSGLDECFFFISLVVRLPYSSIFGQFWWFFVFKLLLSFFWLCEEAQCIYLHLHLGWKSPRIGVFFFFGMIYIIYSKIDLSETLLKVYTIILNSQPPHLFITNCVKCQYYYGRVLFCIFVVRRYYLF